jgi:hypothetical protein
VYLPGQRRVEIREVPVPEPGAACCIDPPVGNAM